MPQVPTVDGPRVQQSPLRGGENTTRAIPTNAGVLTSALGAGISGIGEVGERIQERRDLDEAFRVETKVLADYNQFEQNLRKTRRGAAAKDVVNDVDQWWSKVDDTYGAEVSPRVKQLTAKSLGRARAQALESTGKYQFQEEDRAQTESFTAVNGQEIQRAITIGTPEALASAKGKIGAAVAVFGATRGWAPEQLDAEKQKWTNALHIQAVNALLDGTPDQVRQAKTYFEENRSEIDSANHTRMSKMIEKGVAETNATENAAKWASLPFEKAIENANKVTDPVERKLTIAAVRDLQTDKNIAIQLREREASDKVWQAVANGASLKALPRSLLEQLNGRERVQVNEHYEAERKRRAAEAAGKPVKTDLAVFEKLISMPPEEIARVQLSTYQDRISRGDLEQLMVRRASMLSKDPKKEHEVATVTQHMNTYISTMKLKDESKGAFQKAVLDELDMFKATNKREATHEERTKILDRLSIEQSNFWSSNKRFFEIAPKDRQKFVDDVVPASERADIIKSLNKKGIPVTVQTILDMYQAGQKQ